MERERRPLKTVLEHTEKITPAFRFTGGDFAAWQNEAREKLEELLGLPFVNCDDLFEIEYEVEKENFWEVRFTFQSEEGYFVPCHLLIPHGVQAPAPVVLCLQGHSSGMHISLGIPIYDGDEELLAAGEDRDFAIGAVKRGYCAVAIEQRALGSGGPYDDGAPGCYVSSMANILIGRTTIGERVWDILRTIDVIVKYFGKVIDAENIICLGNSGGGTATLYASCLDTRIKTSIPSCCFASYDDSIAFMRHCTCNYVPGIRRYFDMGDLTGMIAPRNLILVSGEKDRIFPIASAKECFEITKQLYKNTNGKCCHVIGEAGNRFYYDKVWKAYDKL